MLNNIAEKPMRRAVGLMSGTSVDGIDAALIEIGGDREKPAVKICAFENYIYEPAVRAQIFELFEPKKASVDKVGYMNFLLGEFYAEAALSIIRKAGFSPKDIDFIGSHGQTIYHNPKVCSKDGYDIKYTVQIGEGAVISARTGIPCVSDFRVADMAVGGQGAPLVPFTEYLLYKKADKTILLQNIGGIGNVTVIPADCGSEEVFAFDTGPGNMIIDGLVSRLYNGRLTMDMGGKIAESGKINQNLLEVLKDNKYYSLPLPKSTGRELFGAQYADEIIKTAKEKNIRTEDIIATATYLTAWSIADAYKRYIMNKHKADYIVIGGGGSYNKTLVNYIKSVMQNLGVETFIQEELGMNSDAKEAVAFALLADYTIAGKTNSLPKVTGADRAVVMGKISL